MDGLDYRDTVTDFDLPEGTFFDCAVVRLEAVNREHSAGADLARSVAALTPQA
jgi:hypothetical protein